MAPVIVVTTYTSGQYHQNINGNNFRIGFDNNNIIIVTLLLILMIINRINDYKISLSSLSVNYIEYFYHVFPLHPNTYTRLFTDVINPKLSQLTKSVDKFICLKDKIESFSGSLNGVSTYLNVNPAQDLLKLILEFSGDKYAQEVKTNIDSLIQELDKPEVKGKYDQIIQHLNSLANVYNQNLETAYKNFKNEIEKQKSSLETNIKEYIEKINTSLNEHRSCVDQLIDKICDNIKNLKTNHSKLSEFTKYTKKEQLIGYNTKFEYPADTQHFEKIFNAHEKYKECLKSCYSKITCELNCFICQLRYYNDYIVSINNSLNKYNQSLNNSMKIQRSITYLYSLKRIYLNKFKNYLSYVKKLEEIGGYITTMKEALKGIEDKVDEKAVKYIRELKEIDIKEREVKSRIDNIKEVNDSVIARLNIAKYTIDFYQDLQKEIDSLNSVSVDVYYYYDYSNIEYLKLEFYKVRYKVESCEKGVRSKLSEAMEKIKKQIKKEGKEGGTCEVKTLEEKDDDQILQVLFCIDDSIKNILSFIENSLNDINVINYLLPKLQNNKNKSPDINEIKSKVREITNLKDATTKLPKEVTKLNEFVELQENTKILIDPFKGHHKFGSLSRYSNTLDDIISHSNMVIGYINYYSDYLKTVGHVDDLVSSIKKCYESTFETIKGIINKFKLHVKVIIPSLDNINRNICQLNWDISRCCPGYIVQITDSDCSFNTNNQHKYSLDRLKDYMNHVKAYITNIRNNFNVIISVIDKIKKETRYINTYKSVFERLEKFIQCHISYIKCNKKNDVLKETVVKHLEEMIDRLKDTIRIIIVINSIKSSERIQEIECRLKSVESNLSELECAIEGVVRNPIGCSLQSYIYSSTFQVTYDNRVNNLFYNPN